jgi:hypothetical protein
MLNLAREPMLAIGCIQAQKCHTDTCPTGVATQKPWLAHGLDAGLKSVRAAYYVRTLRRDLLQISESCGVAHPALIDADDIDMLYGSEAARPLREVYGYAPGWGRVSESLAKEIAGLMAGSPQGGSAPPSTTAR